MPQIEVEEMEAKQQPQTHREDDDAPALRLRRRSLILILGSALLSAFSLTAFFTMHRTSAAAGTNKTAESKAETKPAAEASLPPDVATASESELKQITVEPVATRTIDVERETTGKVAFNEDRMTPVFTPYAGRVVELLAGKGATVKAGQPLLIIESPDYVAAQNDLAAARSDADKARLALDIAQKSADRAKRLQQNEALAMKDLQQAENDLARAREERRRAEAAVTIAENKLALFGKEKQEIARLAEQPGAVDRRVVIRAPLSGTIVERKVGPGQYVKSDAADPMFLISDLSTLWVMADVYETMLPKIRVGAPVQISVAAYPERNFPARVSFINPTVDAATRTVHVRCVVTNAGGMLKPEMFAKIKLGAAEAQSVPVVPTSAVIAQNDQSLVYVEEAKGRYRRRQVKTGRDLLGATVIEDGLKPGERVVTHGVLLLNGIVGKPADGGNGE